MQRHQLIVTTEKDKVHTFDTIEELSSYHNKVMNIHSADRRKAALREIVLAGNFAPFMSQAFNANELTVDDPLVKSLQATILELPNYLSPRELQQFITPFLDCSATFHAFVANADFMSRVAVRCSADLVDKMLALKIRTTSTNLGKLYHCRKTFQEIAAKFPEEHVARIMGYYMNGFTNWLYCEKRHVLAAEEQGKARAFDFFRNALIPLLENFPIRYGRQVLQVVMDDEFLWQTSLQKQRSITNLLFKLKDKYDDMLIDKIFSNEDIMQYLAREKMLPDFAANNIDVSAFRKFYDFLMTITSQQRAMILSKFNQMNMPLVAMAASYNQSGYMVEYFIANGSDPSRLSPDKRDALVYSLQRKYKRPIEEACKEAVLLLRHNCDPRHPENNFEPLLKYAAGSDSTWISILLDYGIYPVNAVELLTIMIENNQLTIPVYCQMLRYLPMEALLNYDFQDEEWREFAAKMLSYSSITACKLAADIMPPLEVDHEKALSKDRFFTFALMYTLGEGTLACFSKDIIMHIISFCAPDFELQHGKQLLQTCADQKASLQAMRKLSSGVSVLQSHTTTGSRFTFFLSADQLARNYITLRDKTNSDLPSFRESAAPYLKQFATLFKNPGKNAALANRISEMELYTDSAELLFKPHNNQ